MQPQTKPSARRKSIGDEPRGSAEPYHARIPDGAYLAFCYSVHEGESRTYGRRIYLWFRIFDGEYRGQVLRMFLRPSPWPTSRFYIAWSIAHGGPPRSRNTKMAPCAFKGKLFRVLTTTVKPHQTITGPNGKARRGPDLPEPFWYSRIACLLSLEVSNEAPTTDAPDFDPKLPQNVTEFPRKPFSDRPSGDGMVGSMELGVRNLVANGVVAVGDSKLTEHTQPAGEGEKILFSGAIPSPSQEANQDELAAKWAEQKERARQWAIEHGLGVNL